MADDREDGPIIGPIKLATTDFFAEKQSVGGMYIKIQERKRLLPDEEFVVYRTWAKMLLNSIY